jgi:hypothetical protein
MWVPVSKFDANDNVILNFYHTHPNTQAITPTICQALTPQ